MVLRGSAVFTRPAGHRYCANLPNIQPPVRPVGMLEWPSLVAFTISLRMAPTAESTTASAAFIRSIEIATVPLPPLLIGITSLPVP